MMGFSSTGIVIALAVLAIAVLALVAKLWTSKPKRAEKWEKAAIMKQLLELSERENGLVPATPSVRSRTPVSRERMRPGNARLKTTAKTALPIRSKTR